MVKEKKQKIKQVILDFDSTRQVKMILIVREIELPPFVIEPNMCFMGGGGLLGRFSRYRSRTLNLYSY